VRGLLRKVILSCWCPRRVWARQLDTPRPVRIGIGWDAEHPSAGRKSRGGSLLWGLDSPSPSTLLQTFQALPNPHDSPLALGSPTRSAGVVPVARFRAVTVTPESSAVASAAHADEAEARRYAGKPRSSRQPSDERGPSGSAARRPSTCSGSMPMRSCAMLGTALSCWPIHGLTATEPSSRTRPSSSTHTNHHVGVLGGRRRCRRRKR
jgi:hypothetical protein